MSQVTTKIISSSGQLSSQSYIPFHGRKKRKHFFKSVLARYQTLATGHSPNPYFIDVDEKVADSIFIDQIMNHEKLGPTGGHYKM